MIMNREFVGIFSGCENLTCKNLIFIYAKISLLTPWVNKTLIDPCSLDFEHQYFIRGRLQCSFHSTYIHHEIMS